MKDYNFDDIIYCIKNNYSSTPEVITLCGSTRFEELFTLLNEKLTLDRFVVFTLGLFGQEKGQDKGKRIITERMKQDLDYVHKRKIFLSDAILIINPDGYIGESTRSEIQFAEALQKRIIYLER